MPDGFEIVPTDDGLGYWVCYRLNKAFVSSMHLTEDKVRQLRNLSD